MSERRETPSGAHMITTPMSEADALRQAEITAMRALSDAVNRLSVDMREFGSDIKDVRERLITIEAAKFEAKILEIRTEFKEDLLSLRADHQRQIDEIRGACTTSDNRLRVAEGMINRLIVGLLVVAAAGGSMFTVLLQMVTKASGNG